MQSKGVKGIAIGGSKTNIAKKKVQIRKQNEVTFEEIPKSCAISKMKEEAEKMEGDIYVTEFQKQKLLAETFAEEGKLEEMRVVGDYVKLVSTESSVDADGNYVPSEAERMSVAEINNTADYGSGTLNDPRMGVTEKKMLCSTCQKDSVYCPGHFGYIKFNHPIYHPDYMRQVLYVLQCVCNSCGGLLLSNIEARKIANRYSDVDQRLKIMAKKSENYPCTKSQDVVEKARKEGKKGEMEKGELRHCSANPIFIPQKVKEVKQIMIKQTADSSPEPMHISSVIKILSNISDEDKEIFGFNPMDLILFGLLVLPPIDRPPNRVKGIMEPNKITRVYEAIVKLNNEIGEMMETNPSDMDVIRADDKRTKKRPLRLLEKGAGGKREKTLTNQLQNLFEYVELLFGSGKKQGGKKFMGYKSPFEELSGKTGLMRSKVMAKRDNYTARTVLSPDPSLAFGQITIPRIFESILTKVEYVTPYNIDRLYKLLKLGRVTHITRGTGELKGIRTKVEVGVDYKLEIHEGNDVWKLERYLQNGDYVVFNRQPTLHRFGIIAFQAVIRDQRTFGLHPAIVGALNADFDGDEGTLHDIQTVEANVEAKLIMNITECIISEQKNKPVVGAIMDTVTGSYLLTRGNLMMDSDLFYSCISQMSEIPDLDNLTARLKKYHVPMFSGRALFSVLLPPDFSYVHGDVIITEGILIQGPIKKAHIGSESNSIVQALYRKYGTGDNEYRDAAGVLHYEQSPVIFFLTNVSWLVNWWLNEYGFTTGPLDCEVLDPEYVKKRTLEEIANARIIAETYDVKSDNPIQQENKEREILAKIGIVKDVGVTIALEQMGEENSIKIMTDQGSGAKGSSVNIAQIAGLLGQQGFRGKRIEKTLAGDTRTLPHFPFGDESIESRGFVKNSFWSGLTPTELFFHIYAGREGLLDTATATPKSGAIHRILSKALEKLVINSVGAVQDVNGFVFQFLYGSDGFDGAGLTRVPSTQTDKKYLSFIDIDAEVFNQNVNAGFVTKKIYEKMMKEQKPTVILGFNED